MVIVKKLFRLNEIRLILGLALAAFLCGAYVGKEPATVIGLKAADDRKTARLVLQKLDYTENPVDVPNPDRGFYRPGSFVLPVEGGTPSLPNLAATISGTTVPVNARIVYMEFDLKNFSSNAPLNGKPLGPWSAAGARPPNYGTTQPLTPAALN